jgi:antitoxin MazE
MAAESTHSRVAKRGNSLAVRIPRAAAEKLGLSEDSAVALTVKDQSLSIRRTSRKWTLDQLLEGVNQQNAGGEIGYGPPVGGEVW